MTKSKRTTRNSSCGSSDHTDSSEDGSTDYYSGSRKRSRTSSRASTRTSSRASSRATSGGEDDHLDSEDDLEIDYDDDGTNSHNSLNISRLDEECKRELVTVYRRFGQVVKTTAASTTPYIKKAFAVSSIYLFWVTLHFVTAQLYVRYCAHPSIYGFLISPFLISAPHCAAMRWVFTKGGTLIDGMWIILGTWLCSKVIYRDT